MSVTEILNGEWLNNERGKDIRGIDKVIFNRLSHVFEI